jgi:hypothetical protein
VGDVGEAGGGEREDGFLSRAGAAGPGFHCCGGLGTEEYIGESEGQSMGPRYTCSLEAIFGDNPNLEGPEGLCREGWWLSCGGTSQKFVFGISSKHSPMSAARGAEFLGQDENQRMDLCTEPER